jgi:hypothetical protein
MLARRRIVRVCGFSNRGAEREGGEAKRPRYWALHECCQGARACNKRHALLHTCSTNPWDSVPRPPSPSPHLCAVKPAASVTDVRGTLGQLFRCLSPED